MIYLASPYSHPDPAIMQNRYELARNYTFKEIRKGLPMFSPIVHCHDMYLNCKGAESNFNYWREYNIQMLRLSTELHILTLPGWRDSQGVAFELYAAEERSIPTVYVNG